MPPDSPPPRLLDQVRAAIRARHYSPRTEAAYVGWIRRFILFHGKRHPRHMGEAEVVEFLSALATVGQVSASTQNQALGAIVFLYSEVLGTRLEWLAGIVRAKRPVRLPAVLSREEVAALLARLSGSVWLMSPLMYGSGLRLMEVAELRVKDVDVAGREIRVRDGKGRKDRVTVLPARIADAVVEHLVKFAPCTSATFPETGQRRRHHPHESVVQRAVRQAARGAGIAKIATCHTLRHSFATHLLDADTTSAPSRSCSGTAT